MAWQGVWISTDDDDKVLASIPITLHKEEISRNGRFKGITFNGRYRGYGRWVYTYVDDTGILMVEFASGSGPLRRHVLVQMTDDVFELMKTDHPLYSDENLWSTGSRLHTNETSVFLLKWSRPTQKQ